jgi:4-hydroxymandelate oxidase
MNEANDLAVRRAFLRYLAASPVMLAASKAMGQPAFDIFNPYEPQLIERVQDAINVFDFEAAAKVQFPPGHWTYMSMGTDSGGTLQANRDGFQKYRLRVRRLVDGSQTDLTTTMFDRTYPMPIFIQPCGSHKAYHPLGEIATARASRSRETEMILSNQASTGIEDVIEARGRPIWMQLYADANWTTTEAIVKRAEAAGCPALAITVDNTISNREPPQRHHRESNPACMSCHDPVNGTIPEKPMWVGLPQVDGDRTFLDWDWIDRIRDMTTMKVFLKGIVNREDAYLSLEHGVDGVIISNHGGRAEDSGVSTVECVAEVSDAIGGRIPIIVDSGFRRGTDIFKGLALGADVVGIGRPYLWGLGTFGQEGVETVLDILKRELTIVMKQAGTPTVADINSSYIM